MASVHGGHIPPKLLSPEWINTSQNIFAVSESYIDKWANPVPRGPDRYKRTTGTSPLIPHSSMDVELLRLFLDSQDPSEPEARCDSRPSAVPRERAMDAVHTAARPDGKIAQFSATDVFRKMTSLGRL